MTFAGLPLWILLAGLLPLIGGVVLLYLLRRTPRPQVVSDIDFWMKAVQEAKPRTLLAKRLPLWSLLLTLLIALLLWFESGDPRFGEEIEGLSVVVVDAGHTMNAVEDGLSRKDRALELVMRRIDQSTADGEVVVVRAGIRPSVIVSKTADRAAFESVRQDFTIDEGASDVDAAMELADSIARAHGELHPESERRIFFVGDRAPDARPETPAIFVPVGGAADTLAVTRLTTRRDPSAVGEYTVMVEVSSFARIEARTRLLVQDRDTTIFDQVVELSPGDVRVFTADGFSSLEGEIHAFISDTELDDGEDAFLNDDHAFAVAGALSLNRVLLLTEGNPFLEAALSVHHALESETRPLSAARELSAEELSGFDAVIVDGGTVAGPLPHRAVLYVRTDGADFERGEWLSAPAVTSTLTSHPALEGLRFESSRIREAGTVLPASTDRVLVRSQEHALMLAREGDGRRSLFVGFRLEDSNLVGRPVFPLFIHHALNWLQARPEAALATLVPGEQMRVDQDLVVLGPDDEARDVLSSWVNDTEQAGFYHPGERSLAVSAAPFFSALPAPHDRVAARGTRALPPLTLILGLFALILIMVEWGLTHRGRLA